MRTPRTEYSSTAGSGCIVVIMRGSTSPLIFLGASVLALACAPRVNLPTLTPDVQHQSQDSVGLLARALAPDLYLQRDEPFPLDRVAAIVHPTRPIVAYHLLWRHDINGQWAPWAEPSDEEVVWVGYDPATGAPRELWTYWHGTLLHTLVRTGDRPAVDVQWGKHGSLPHRVIESDLPRHKTLNVFYVLSFLLLPDMFLGRLSHGGPVGFFHDYARYRAFTHRVTLGDRLDAVFRTQEPEMVLPSVFGPRYSHKTAWPSP